MSNKNIVWHQHKVSKHDRQSIKKQKSCIVWFTGLSASGKSTIANALELKLHDLNKHTYLLDGDNIRMGLNKDLGFSNENRDENIRRIGEVGKLFVESGLIVLCAFISPSQKERDRIRMLVDKDEFVEVFVDTPLDICQKRDPKGLYKKVKSGEIANFTGISSPYEAPKDAEIVIKTDMMSVEESVGIIIKYLNDKGYTSC